MSGTAGRVPVEITIILDSIHFFTQKSNEHQNQLKSKIAPNRKLNQQQKNDRMLIGLWQ